MAKIAIPRSKNASGKTSSGLSQNQLEEVQRLAYQLYLERGGEHGHDLEDWTRAESIIRSRKS